MWNVPFALSENRCAVINEIPALQFPFSSHITKLLFLEKVGRRTVGTAENNFPLGSVTLPLLLSPLCGHASLPLGRGKELSKVFKSAGSGVTENGI